MLTGQLNRKVSRKGQPKAADKQCHESQGLKSRRRAKHFHWRVPLSGGADWARSKYAATTDRAIVLISGEGIYSWI